MSPEQLPDFCDQLHHLVEVIRNIQSYAHVTGEYPRYRKIDNKVRVELDRKGLGGLKFLKLARRVRVIAVQIFSKLVPRMVLRFNHFSISFLSNYIYLVNIKALACAGSRSYLPPGLWQALQATPVGGSRRPINFSRAILSHENICENVIRVPILQV